MKTKKKRVYWIPMQLLRFYLWQETFMTEIQDSIIAPLTGIPMGAGSKMDALLALQATYVSAYNAAPPYTYPGRSLITARNTAEKAFKEGIRQITAQYIRNNDALSNYQKQVIGLPITANTGSGKHAISTSIVERIAPEYPSIDAKSNSPGTVTFTFHELGNAKSRGIPAGMHHCLIQYILTAANAATPTGEDACTKHLEAQKSPFTKDVKRETAGQKLWGFAAWVDTRGVIHSWSPVFSCIVT